MERTRSRISTKILNRKNRIGFTSTFIAFLKGQLEAHEIRVQEVLAQYEDLQVYDWSKKECRNIEDAKKDIAAFYPSMARFANRFSTEPIHSKVFIITKNRDVIRKVKMTSNEWKDTLWRQYDSSANRKAYLEETGHKSVIVDKGRYRGRVRIDYKVLPRRYSVPPPRLHSQ